MFFRAVQLHQRPEALQLQGLVHVVDLQRGVADGQDIAPGLAVPLHLDQAQGRVEIDAVQPADERGAVQQFLRVIQIPAVEAQEPLAAGHALPLRHLLFQPVVQIQNLQHVHGDAGPVLPPVRALAGSHAGAQLGRDLGQHGAEPADHGLQRVFRIHVAPAVPELADNPRRGRRLAPVHDQVDHQRGAFSAALGQRLDQLPATADDASAKQSNLNILCQAAPPHTISCINPSGDLQKPRIPKGFYTLPS